MESLRVRNRAKLRAFQLRLRWAFETSGYTQVELAKRTGVNLSTVGALFRRQAIPRTEVLLLLIEALDISADWLLLNRGHPREHPPKNAPKPDEVRGALAALDEAEHALRQVRKRWR